MTSRVAGLTDLHDTAAVRLRTIGQRYTPNRRTLVEVLAAAERPLTITQVLGAGADLPQSSVYRNLQILEQARVVRRVAGADEFGRYELSEDLIGHHHHLVCSSCGAVEDFTAPPHLERAMARAMGEVTGERRFSPESHHIQLRGRCRSCAPS